jgi:hypothetical protein
LPPPVVKSLLKEPLLHFIVLGVALFLLDEVRGGGSESNRIVIGSGQIAYLAAGFERTWTRPPSEAELKHMLDEWVREEIAVREAFAAGLDRDDTVIRRRLRQKLEFLLEDSADLQTPTPAEQRAWYAEHADALRGEARIGFRQVYLSPQRHGAALEQQAADVLARLRVIGAAASVEQFGDATQLPAELDTTALSDIDSRFGNGFAESLAALPTGTWAGPVRSGYGLHLIWIQDKLAGELPEFELVQPLVEREIMRVRRQAQIDAVYAGLLDKYSVELRSDPSAYTGPADTASR